MFDFMKTMGSPELMKVVEQLPQKVQEWSAFLTRLSASQGRADEAAERIENNLAFIVQQNEENGNRLLALMNASHLTAEIHDDVLAHAPADPRNQLLDTPTQ